MRSPQQNATDQTANFFWVLVMIFGAALVVWWLRPQWIVVPIFDFRLVEVYMLKGLITSWDEFARMLHLPMPSMHDLNVIEHFILTTHPSKVDFDDFSQVNVYLGHWMRYPVIAILLAMAAIVHFKHTSLRFRTAYSMKALRKSEVENWPQITPVLSLDLVKEDLEKGPWAMAKLPLDFCREYDMLEQKKKGDKNVWAVKQGPAYRLFAMQLGHLWPGATRLPIHVKALIAIFIARAERDGRASHQFLSQIAASAATGKLDFTGVTEYIQAHQDSRIIKWLEKRHAYTNTLMASMLEIARAEGVLATAEFLWLKPVDRRLWFMLNSVGRQTAVIEVSGLFAHWLAEKKLKQAIKTPMVKEAVVGLEEAIENILYVDEGDQWRTTNAA